MCVCAKSLLSCLTLCDPLTVAHQVSLSMAFSRQEYWSELSCSPPGDLPDPEIEPCVFYVSCIGRWVLYHDCHLESTRRKGSDLKRESQPLPNSPVLFLRRVAMSQRNLGTLEGKFGMEADREQEVCCSILLNSGQEGP